MFTNLQKQQFNEILEEMGNNLDITQSQYNAAVTSYQAVGLHLAKHDSPLGKYSPEILPQGSFMLGTMIKPIHEDDDLDIDLVCQLVGKEANWTQFDLKRIVGEQLRSHATYAGMIKEPEGRRCWTLEYSEQANYHMDILPSIVDSGYRIILEKAFSANELANIDGLALRITDNQTINYKTDTNHLNWLKSNPFGYARWFFDRASLHFVKSFSESVQPVPEYSQEKLPLQRVVQILKRHRDMMFDGDIQKPISIIITTLAAQAYGKELNLLDALSNIVATMPNFIEERYSPEHGKVIKWIRNPINEEENFADKWIEFPKRQENFMKWMKQVQNDLAEAQGRTGISNIQESLQKSFGDQLISKTFSNIAEKTTLSTKQGNTKIDFLEGVSTSGSINVKPHNFYGEEK
jgi:hypothetical protein